MPAMEIIATQGKVVVLNHDKRTRSVTQEADPMQVGAAHFPHVTPMCNSHAGRCDGGARLASCWYFTPPFPRILVPPLPPPRSPGSRARNLLQLRPSCPVFTLRFHTYTQVPEALSRAWRPALLEGLPQVFTGGWVGYAGYDTVRYVYSGKASAAPAQLLITSSRKEAIPRGHCRRAAAAIAWFTSSCCKGHEGTPLIRPLKHS